MTNKQIIEVLQELKSNCLHRVHSNSCKCCPFRSNDTLCMNCSLFGEPCNWEWKIDPEKEFFNETDD